MYFGAAWSQDIVIIIVFEAKIRKDKGCQEGKLKIKWLRKEWVIHGRGKSQQGYVLVWNGLLGLW